jgi:hypothetical protein
MVLDPAVGTGTLLLAASRQLAERGVMGGDLAAIAEGCLFGIDIDPLAVELAISSLWLETGARRAVLANHLRCGDFLADTPLHLPMAIDAIISNPPWGAEYDPATRRRLKQRYPHSMRGPLDSFKLFLDRASQVSRGTVGMIVPQAMLAQERHQDIRALMLQRMVPAFGCTLNDGDFPDVAAPACILVFGPSAPPARDGSAPATTRRTDLSWTPHGFWLSGQPMRALLARLQERHLVLRDVRRLYRVRDTGINYNRAAVARRIFYEGAVSHDPRDVARYRGRNFGRYTHITPGGWLRHDAAALLAAGETLSLDWPTYHRIEKIVLRQTADRLVATLDRTRMALGRSVIAITAEGDGSLAALLACLNSRLLTALYRALAGETGRLLPQVKVGRLLALPVPKVSAVPLKEDDRRRARNMIEAGDWEELIERVAVDSVLGWACLELLAQSLLADPSPPGPIDRIVYCLYGLTPQEISLVEMDPR